MLTIFNISLISFLAGMFYGTTLNALSAKRNQLLMFLLLIFSGVLIAPAVADKTTAQQILMFAIVPLTFCLLIHKLIWKLISHLFGGIDGDRFHSWIHHINASLIVNVVILTPNELPLGDVNIKPIKNLSATFENTIVWLIFPVAVNLLILIAGEVLTLLGLLIFRKEAEKDATDCPGT